MKDFKSAAKAICFHTKIMLRGFAKMLYGTVTAGLIGFAVYGFAAIPSEGGYAAVCDFIGAVALTVVALCCLYLFGSTKRRGHFSTHK